MKNYYSSDEFIQIFKPYGRTLELFYGNCFWYIAYERTYEMGYSAIIAPMILYERGHEQRQGLFMALATKLPIIGTRIQERQKRQHLEQALRLKLMAAFRTHGFTIEEQLTFKGDEKPFKHTRYMPMFLKGPNNYYYEGNLFIQSTPEQQFFQMPIHVKKPPGDNRALTFGYGKSSQGVWQQWVYHYVGEKQFDKFSKPQQRAFLEELLQAEPDIERLQLEYEQERKSSTTSKNTAVYWNRDFPERAFSQMT